MKKPENNDIEAFSDSDPLTDSSEVWRSSFAEINEELSRSGIDTKRVDSFRQGVENILPRHYVSGLYKIGSGEKRHFLKKSVFGQSVITRTRTHYFSDRSVPDAVTYLLLDKKSPSVPLNLVAGSIDETFLTLSWDASSDNEGVSFYEIQIQYPGQDYFTWKQNVSATSALVVGLIPFTSYKFRVRALDAAGNSSGWSNELSVSTVDITAPSIPQNLVASNIQATSLTVSWDPSTDNSGAVSYELQIQKPAGPWEWEATTVLTSVNVASLLEYNEYSFRVKAIDAALNESGWSNILIVETLDITSPSAPANFRTSEETNVSMKLEWDPSTDGSGSGINRYVVQRKFDSQSNIAFTEITPNFSSPQTLSDFSEASALRLRVKAVDNYENSSAWSPNDNGLFTQTFQQPLIPNLPLANGSINCIVADGLGNYYIGGDFTTLQDSFSTHTVYGLARLFSNGQVDSTFSGPPLNGDSIYCICLAGNYLFAGGDFKNLEFSPVNQKAIYRISTSSGAWDNWDPKLEYTIDPLDPTTPIVFSIVWDQYNDKLYVGGLFRYAVDAIETRERIARFDISDDTSNYMPLLDSWNPGIDGILYTMSIVGSGPGQSLIVGGSFGQIGFGAVSDIPSPVTRNSIARLGIGTIATLENWNPSVNGTVYAIRIDDSLTYVDEKIYVAGSFETIGGVGTDINPVATRKNIARLSIGTSATLDAWNPSITFSSFTPRVVSSLDLINGFLYAHGQFDQIGGSGTDINPAVTRKNIARFGIGTNASLETPKWSPEIEGFGPGFNQTIANIPNRDRIFVVSSAISIENEYDSYNGELALLDISDPSKISAPTGLTSSNITDNSVDISWNASSYSGVVGLITYQVSYKLNSDPNTDNYWSFSGSTTSLSFSVTGLFSYVSYDFRVRAVAYSGKISTFSNSLTAQTTDSIAPTVPANLTSSAATDTSLTLTWDASTDNVAVTEYEVQQRLDSGVDGDYVTIATVAAPTVTLAVTGLTGATEYRFRVRAKDGATNASAWGPNDTGLLATTEWIFVAPSVGAGQINVIIKDGSRGYYIGGTFTSITDSVATYDTGYERLVRLQPDGTVDPGFSCPVSGEVLALALDSTGLYVGGIFNGVNSVSTSTRNRIARVRPFDDIAPGAVDAWDFNAGNTVRALLLDSVNGKIYIAGTFTSPRSRIARVATGNTASIDTWNPGTINSTVNSLALDSANSFLYIGGSFAPAFPGFPSVGSASRGRLARLTSGAVAEVDSWEISVGGTVSSLVLDNVNSKIYIGGLFNGTNSVGTSIRNRLARLTTGAAATLDTWDPNVSSEPRDLALDSTNGFLYVCGLFSSVSATTRNRIARVTTGATSTLDAWNPNVSVTVGSASVQGILIYPALFRAIAIGNFDAIANELDTIGDDIAGVIL